MFEPVPAQVDFVAQEHEILKVWRERGDFEKLRRLREGSPRWSFIDGPITANNPMGVHHGWGRTYKDLFHRFKAMQGYQTRYQNGFDCQGLWVEVNVEKDQGFKSKRDIEGYGLAEFVILCKQRVLTYAAVQTEQSVRLGYWMDWNDPDFLRLLRDLLGQDPAQVITLEGPRGAVTGTVESIVGRLGMAELGGSYFTFSDENNYAIWGVLKSCHERGWIYKGRDVMPWCGRCGTGLSQHEIVTEGYQEITHPSVTLRFPLRGRPGESLLVWTTTPWTLTSNVAAAVGPELTYLRVRQGDERFYLSRGTTEMLRGPFEVEAELRGAEMVGWEYEGPFDDLPAQVSSGAPAAHRVIPWSEVGEEEGTGIVHIAPGCGAEDFQLGKEHGLPVLAPLDEAGIFVEGYAWLTGQTVREVASPIFEDLKRRGLSYHVADYTHRYPVCWRCHEELIFRLVDEWFISMGEKIEKPYEEITSEEKDRNLRYQMIEGVLSETRWFPAFGKDRELDWLLNMHDWMISKKRYWGLALPIWECPSCGHFDVIGSRKELQERCVEGWEVFEGHTPHRPYVDAVRIACSRCGARANRIPDVGNPWLDAGIVAMSTTRYHSDRAYWQKWFPADWISESFPGQFRNWFYSLLAMSTILERRAPFKEIFTYGTLMGEDGRPMHKSWGNAIEFNEAADKMGVDVMRWMFCGHKPEKDLWFGYHGADEVRRQFLLPLWNVYAFFVTYARIDGWTPAAKRRARLSVLDRWMLSRLHEVVDEVTSKLEGCEPNTATEALNRLIDEVSNWYLRRSRRRFWARAGASAASDSDKNAAYATLYEVITTLIRLLAPFTPFVTEVIYQNLVRGIDPAAPESVHHCRWPTPDREWIDRELTRDMALVMRLASLGHAARNKANRKLRQPLSEAALSVGGADERAIIERHADLLAEELNVKHVRLLDAASEAVDFKLNPYPRQLGQKYGARFPAIRKALLALEPEAAGSRLLSGQSLRVQVEGEAVEILPEEVEVRMEAHAGLEAAADGAYIAALRTEISPELHAEGLAREFVRRVQEQRKASGLEVADRIHLSYQASPALQAALETHRAYVQGELLADRIVPAGGAGDEGQDHGFEGEIARVWIRKAARP